MKATYKTTNSTKVINSANTKTKTRSYRGTRNNNGTMTVDCKVGGHVIGSVFCTIVDNSIKTSTTGRLTPADMAEAISVASKALIK